MPRRSDEAIVLKTRPVGDADLIVTLFTAGEGKLEGAAKTARKSRRRFGGVLEPLSRGRATWTETEGRDLVRLEGFEILASFAGLQADLAWFYLFAYLAEVTDTFALEREPDARFYRLLRAATDAAAAGASTGLVRRWFEVWTLRLQGILPDLDVCSLCGTGTVPGGAALATTTSATLCGSCASRSGSEGAIVHLTREELDWIRKALKAPAGKTPEPPPTPGLRSVMRLLLLNFTGRPFRSARFLESAHDER